MQIYFMTPEGDPIPVPRGSVLVTYDSDEAEIDMERIRHAGDDFAASVTDVHEMFEYESDERHVTVDMAWAKRFNKIRQKMLIDENFTECEWNLGGDVVFKLVND